MIDRDRTLVTGYGPFGNVTDNPSARLARGCGRPHQVLDVAFEAADAFLEALDPNSFDRLLLLGVAETRRHVTPEVYAHNQIGQARDVHGNDRSGPIDPQGPELVESTLWGPEDLAEILRDDRTRTSLDAGRYLCNFISYRAILRFPDKKVGFLHVPSPEHMAIEQQADVLARVLAVIERERVRA